ncbi:hypothetical protein ACIRH0_12705 [Streptomyces sp. NPDC093675]|uniref:hypothetical protein n=1 Tax=Streptomyces sp. NPDC093675 TaxID=3366049 RepID=UPI0037FA2579
MSPNTLEEGLRVASARVFGNRYRAELMLALASADDGGICLGDLADANDAPASVYYVVTQTLVEAGLAEKLPRVEGERRRWYRRNDHGAFWPCLHSLLTCLTEVAVPAEATRRREWL